MIRSRHLSLGVFAACALLNACATAPVEIKTPATFATDGLASVWTDHAVGVQIYECKLGKDGQLAWAFREPLATLMHDGKTMGRHFAGPAWSFNGGEEVVGKVLETQPGRTAKDIPVLKLAVSYHSGEGPLAKAKIILRLNTRGGVLAGPCTGVGDLRTEDYSADYVFLEDVKDQ